MTAPKQLLRLVAASRKADKPQPLTLPGDEIRFVMAFAEPADPEQIEAKLRLITESASILVEPLFPDTAEPRHSFLLLRLAGSDLASASQAELHRIGYWLENEFGLAACEPDLPSDLYADPVPPGDHAEHLPFRAGDCWTETPHSDDETWSNKATRVPQAWKLAPGKGHGILVGQPDTGIATHSEVDPAALRLDLAHDTLQGDADPADPLDPATANPGHGTATASVVISATTGRLAGSAPGAELVPIRCIDNVVVLFGVSVARAIHHARKVGCHVITLSLGGLPSVAMKAAIDRAIGADVLVLAAAGNCVQPVVYPARYRKVVAVAATGIDNQPWQYSGKGAQVDFSAPGDNVWRAGFDLKGGKTETVGFGKGTSYSVAISAGIAALWLSHHGRDRLIEAARDRGVELQTLFAAAVAQSAQVPFGWDHEQMGAGVIDAEALLRLPIADIDTDQAGYLIAGAVSEETDNEDIVSLVEEVTGIAAAPEALDWAGYRHELGRVAFEYMKRQMTGAVPALPPDRFSDRLRFAIEKSGDPALLCLIDNGTPRGGSSAGPENGRIAHSPSSGEG